MYKSPISNDKLNSIWAIPGRPDSSEWPVELDNYTNLNTFSFYGSLIYQIFNQIIIIDKIRTSNRSLNHIMSKILATAIFT